MGLAPPSAGEAARLEPGRLQVFNNWSLARGNERPDVGLREKRVLALLALTGARSRSYIAGILWPASSERHAGANLRESLSRLHRQVPGIVVARAGTVDLDPRIALDLAEFRECAHEITTHGSTDDPLGAVETLAAADLLPGWYEDWVVAERTHIEQMRLRSLERIAGTELTRDPNIALQAALAAVRLDPLRDAAQRALLKVHLHEGNDAEAVRHFAVYRSQLRAEMGLEPSRATRELMRSLRPGEPSLPAALAPERSDILVEPCGPWSSFQMTADAVLSFLNRRIAAGLWLVTRSELGLHRIVAVCGRWHDRSPERTQALADAYCPYVIGSGTRLFKTTRRGPVPMDGEALQTVLGIPLLADGDQTYGTLCAFFGPGMAQSLEHNAQMIHLLGRLLSTLVSRGAETQMATITAQ
jgi:DNA-binding SARP family transcriptional activator